MNGTRKAAILWNSLDKTLATQVLALLSRAQAEQVIVAAATVADAPVDERNSVLQEFKTQFQTRPTLPQSVPAIERERVVAASSIDRNPQGASTANTEPLRPARPLQRPVESSGMPEAGPFDFLIGRQPDEVRQLLQDEQSQTIAVIAAQLPPAQSAAVLAGLPPDRQADILQRVARLGPTDPEILLDVATALKERLSRPRVRAGGVAQAAAVLKQSSRSASRTVLQTLDDQDADLADELRQTLFSFDDLLRLDDDTLRIILQETDDRQWALALKASPAAVRQKVLECLPARVARAFKDEMESLGPVRLSEMTSVRQQIAESIRRLEDAGMIALPVN